MFTAYSPKRERSLGGLALDIRVCYAGAMDTGKTDPTLANFLRRTADRLDQGAHYEWGHMGRCNCGHLVQTITSLTSRQIAESVNHQLDEWSEHARDYCTMTESPVDDLFRALAEVGFSHRDVMALEYLSDPRVLTALGPQGQTLRRNHAPDVSLYMRTLAGILEEAQPHRELSTSRA